MISKNLSSYDTTHHFKIKVCLLGGTEIYKNEFQKSISSNCLPIENKKHIGVNISKIQIGKDDINYELFLWNIDCNQQWSFLRTIYYCGAVALIVFISENKVDQIIKYLTEIKLRMPIIQVYFCIILERSTKEEIVDAFFKQDRYKSFLLSNNIEFNEISNPLNIFEKICALYNKKRIAKLEEEDNFFINYIPVTALIKQSEISDNCNDYNEPVNDNLRHNKNRRINTAIIKEYLHELNIDIDFNINENWIYIENQKYGTFSISLTNGKVRLFPKICTMCKIKNCTKHYNAPYFICIEQESFGWTNIRGLGQPELLILSKIITLKKEIVLPKAVLKQIHKINTCIK